MIDRKAFKKALAAPLENGGCVNKGQSWYLDGQDALVVINLQKSDWSELYYINIGIWLKALGEPSFPQFDHCHLSYRVEHFFPQQRELILTGCSLDKSNPRLLGDLSRFIADQLMPFLQQCVSEVSLRKLMSQSKLDGGLVRAEARKYLSSQTISQTKQAQTPEVT